MQLTSIDNFYILKNYIFCLNNFLTDVFRDFGLGFGLSSWRHSSYHLLKDNSLPKTIVLIIKHDCEDLTDNLYILTDVISPT